MGPRKQPAGVASAYIFVAVVNGPHHPYEPLLLRLVVPADSAGCSFPTMFNEP